MAERGRPARRCGPLLLAVGLTTQLAACGGDAARRGEAQSTYAEGEPPASTFGESISLWESADVASDRLATFASMTSGCRSFEEELPDGRRAVISVVQRDAPPPGRRGCRAGAAG